MPRKVEISAKSIVFGVLFVLSLYLGFQLQSIVLTLFINIILATALAPYVDLFQKKLHLTRGLSITLVYLITSVVVALLVFLVTAPLVDQTSQLINALPQAIRKVDFLNTHEKEITDQLLSKIGSLPENLYRIIVGVFSNLFAVLTTIVVSYYLLLERPKLSNYLDLFTSSLATKNRALNLVQDIEFHLGGWVRGELVLMFTVGLITYIGLSILGIKIALPLAIIAGLLEIIPNIGPVISAIPAVLIALTIHPAIVVGVIALYVAVQFAENYFLVPRIMQQAVGINPLVIIVGLMAGSEIAGPIGAILAIPFFIVIRSLLAHYHPKLPQLPHEV